MLRNNGKQLCVSFNACQKLLNFSYTSRKVLATIPCIQFWHALRILCSNEIETINTSR